MSNNPQIATPNPDNCLRDREMLRTADPQSATVTTIGSKRLPNMIAFPRELSSSSCHTPNIPFPMYSSAIKQGPIKSPEIKPAHANRLLRRETVE